MPLQFTYFLLMLDLNTNGHKVPRGIPEKTLLSLRAIQHSPAPSLLSATLPSP
jgi:hypothetical protein